MSAAAKIDGPGYWPHVRYLGPAGHILPLDALHPGEVGYGIPLDGTEGPGSGADLQRIHAVLRLMSPPEKSPTMWIPIRAVIGPTGFVPLFWTVDIRPFVVENGVRRPVNGKDPAWSAARAACEDMSAWFAVRWELVRTPELWCERWWFLVEHLQQMP